jgi:hypothetical protein
LLSGSQKESDTRKVTSFLPVPVVGRTGIPLDPCHPARARQLVRKKKAVRRFLAGIFYIQLTQRENGVTHPVVIAIDPGSKREAITVKSEYYTFMNLLADTVSWVKSAKKTQKMMRVARRGRNTPCRKSGFKKQKGFWVAPSTLARWGLKLRIVNIARKLFPITDYVVEDVKAATWKGSKKWNGNFSPLEVGKQWFYSELRKLGNLELKSGWETKQLRDALGLKKTKNKMQETFTAHNSDSWVLANWFIGGHTKPDNTTIFRLIPLQFHRRRLHILQPAKGGLRRVDGGTMSDGWKRGSIVKHKKWGVCYLGGCMEGKGLSLHSLKTGKRLTQNAKKKDMVVMCFNSWRWYRV